MSAITLTSIVFAIVFAAALTGMFLRTVLPENHLSDAAKDTVRIGIGLVVTIAGMVLSLLIWSAKNNYDTQRTELTEMSAKVALLDRVLAHYGPEAKEPRDAVRAAATLLLDRLSSQDRNALQPVGAASEVLYDKIQELSPQNDSQRWLQGQALSIALAIGQTRWLMYEQSAASMPTPLLAVLIFWLVVIFISFGLYAPNNLTVVCSFFVSALVVSCAVFLILEMYSPFGGIIRISTAPLRAALANLGH
ncbi:MAG TPA: hypothetical protein VMT20_27745 [Terriglobia bacterium]|nr:hypothetical protein [Terriglobia bacterium]